MLRWCQRAALAAGQGGRRPASSRAFSSAQNKDEEEDSGERKFHKPGLQWRKTWAERRDEWQMSKLAIFQTERKSRYLEIAAMSEGAVSHFKNAWERARDRSNGTDQEYLKERVRALGPDLAAAFFYCFRGAKVKMHNKPDWITTDNSNRNLPLPNKFTEGIFIERIDLENFIRGNLQFEGLQHLKDLHYIKWLSLRNQSNVDDWCLDYIVQMTHTSLEYLDISGTGISHRGLFALAKMNQLNLLVVEEKRMVGDFEIACSMLEHDRPNVLVKMV